MDSLWFKVALTMGHQPIIVPQATLDNNLFFLNTDVLIISNAEIALNSMEVDNILQFIESGKPVYIQSEHLQNYTTNQAFVFIVQSLGGSFKWNKYFQDYLTMNVLGDYAINNNSVDTITCWYSISGKGDCNTINILENGGEFHGWQYVPQNPLFGSIITIPDQDWIFEFRNLSFMENILTNLISPPPIPPENQLSLGNDTVLCKGDSLILDVGALNGSYLWNDNSTLSTFTLRENGAYWLTADVDCGTLSDSIFIETEQCNCHVYTPNVFSPNSENGNNQFSIQSNCQFAEFHLSIFDRWGELVFQTRDASDSWDGTFRGNQSPLGVYAVSLEYKFIDDSPVQYFSNVTLVR